MLWKPEFRVTVQNFVRCCLILPRLAKPTDPRTDTKKGYQTASVAPPARKPRPHGFIALFRFGEAEAAGRNSYRTARALLMRELPRITGIKKGKPVTPPGVATVEASIEAVANLRDSYLLIQGPPGTGKTYTASHVIVEMLGRGKRVGVASNSHKVIHHLLDDVECVACEKRVFFRGVKKASGRNEESFFKADSLFTGSSVVKAHLSHDFVSHA